MHRMSSRCILPLGYCCDRFCACNALSAVLLINAWPCYRDATVCNVRNFLKHGIEAVLILLMKKVSGSQTCNHDIFMLVH